MLKNVRLLDPGGKSVATATVPQSVVAKSVPLLIWSGRYWLRNPATGEFVQIEPYVVPEGYDSENGVVVENGTWQPSAGHFEA